MTRILLAAPWTALLVAGLLPWLSPTVTLRDETKLNEPRRVEVSRAEETPSDEEMDDRKSRRNHFAVYQEQITQELIDGKITLRQFVDRVFTYCLTRYPEHLVYIQNTEVGCSLRAKIGINAANIAAVPGPCCHLPNFAELSERIGLALREFLCEEEEESRSSLPPVSLNLH